MIDLIDRKRLLNSRVYSTRSGKPNYEKMFKNLVNDIENAPSVDIEAHAHWIKGVAAPEHYICSECGGQLLIYDEKANYCPNCGYKMDEEFDVCGDCEFIDTDCKGWVWKYDEVGKCEKFKRKGKNL